MQIQKIVCLWILVMGCWVYAKVPNHESRHCATFTIHSRLYNLQDHQTSGLNVQVSSAPGHQNDQRTQEFHSMVMAAVTKSFLGTTQYNEVCRQQYVKKYGVDAEILKILYDKDFEDLQHWIISNKNLNRSQALHIWQGYCDKRYFRSAKKNNGRICIIQKYDKRVDDEQAQKVIAEKQIEAQRAQLVQERQEQEILLFCEQQIKNQYDLLDFSSESCPESVRCERQEALSQTENDGYVSYDQEHYLSPQAAAFLQKHHINYLQVHNFHGTALQQQLHAEVCDIFEQAAQKQSELWYQSDVLKQCVLCADAAYDANQLGQIQTVVSLNNLGFTLLEYSQAIVTATLKGCENTAYTVTHLEETAESVGKVLYYAVETLALNDYDKEYTFSPLHDPLRDQLRDQRNAEIAEGLHKLGNAIENSTGPQRVQAVTQFAVEWYGNCKMPKIVGGVMGIAEFTAMKGASCIESEINASKAAQKVEALAQESNMQKAIAKGFTDAQKAGIVATEARIATRSITEVLTDIQKFGGKISVSKVELHHNTKYWLEQVCAKVNTKIESALLEQYNKMTQIVGNAETSVCMDLEHIVNVGYTLVEDASGAYHTVKLTGGHLAGTMSKLAQEGLVEIQSFVEFGGGCIEYQVKDLFTGRMFTHTEFPAHWNVEKIAQETKCLVENAITNGSLPEATNIPVIATTSEGFKLKIITDFAPKTHDCVSIENTVNRHIVTSRPHKG